jgi:hypothetical protein
VSETDYFCSVIVTVTVANLNSRTRYGTSLAGGAMALSSISILNQLRAFSLMQGRPEWCTPFMTSISQRIVTGRLPGSSKRHRAGCVGTCPFGRRDELA